MKKTSEPIVFFGSGPVAAESLRLLDQDFTIEAVITKPRPEHHKGDVPVLDAVAQLKLPVKLAASKAELDKLFAGRPFKSRVAVLIDFGIIVPQDVIHYFPLGIINSHFSLLPEWRGADPITFAILSGQKRTGVSLMLLVKAMDEGPLLACGIEELDGTETTPGLTARLIQLSYALLRKELPRHLAGETKGVPQSDMASLIPGHPSKPSYSRKLTKEDGLLDWDKPAEVLEREIRAFIEWPKSRTTLGNKDVIITKAHAVPDSDPAVKPGNVDPSLINDGILQIGTTNGALRIDTLKPAGKQEMTGKAFLAGYRLS